MYSRRSPHGDPPFEKSWLRPCLWVRGGMGGVAVKIRLPIGLYLETFLERDVILRLLSSSLTLQSQVTIGIEYADLPRKRTCSETMVFISKLIYLLKYHIYLTNLQPQNR